MSAAEQMPTQLSLMAGGLISEAAFPFLQEN